MASSPTGTTDDEADASASLTAPLLVEQETSPETDGQDDPQSSPQRGGRCCNHGKSIKPSPEQTKNIVLLFLFAASTIFQVYAGLKVATLDHHNHSTTSHHHYETIITPLLCLTVLWINAEGYVFRTLLSELTREDGLFLPPQVHRHPMYLENGRGLAVHWCDLCRQRIQGTGCFRCSLCDFDVVSS